MCKAVKKSKTDMHDSLMIAIRPSVTDKHFVCKTLMKQFKVLRFHHFVTKLLNFREDYFFHEVDKNTLLECVCVLSSKTIV